MRVLLTGGCGFVGVNLARRLLADDPALALTIVDLAPPDAAVTAFLAPHVGRVHFVTADVADPAALAGLEADAAVHAAMVAHVPAWERARPRAYVDVNVTGTVNVLEWARALPLRGPFVYVSTGGVYGEPGPHTPDGPQPEEGPIDPPELYAITKHASELLVRRWGELFGLDVRRARLSGVFGPMERSTGSRTLLSPVHALVRAALTGEPLRLTARTLDAVGDHLGAEDVADGLARLLRAANPPHPVYNVAQGAVASVRDLLALLEEAGASVPIDLVDAADAQLDLDPANTRGRWGAYRIEHARADLGWEPRPLAEQLASYLAWARSAVPPPR